MSIFVSETLMSRYLNNAMAQLNKIVENGSIDQQLSAASQLSQIVLTIARMETDEAILDDRENWQKFEDESDEDSE